MFQLRKKIKAYLAFTPFLYKILIFFLLPVLLIGGGYLLETMYSIQITQNIFGILVFTEVLADHLLFTGIYRKGKAFELLNSSCCGSKILLDSLRVDRLWRFLENALVIGCVMFVNGWEVSVILMQILLMDIILSLTFFVTRHFLGIQPLLLFGWIAGILMQAVWLLSAFFMFQHEEIFLAGGVLGVIGVSAFTEWMNRRVVRDDYYDNLLGREEK